MDDFFFLVDYPPHFPVLLMIVCACGLAVACLLILSGIILDTNFLSAFEQASLVA